MSIEFTDEIPEDALCVCAPADAETPFEDNVEAECFFCGCKIIHRPYVPAAVKKVCIDCMFAKVHGVN